jgi:hypothetical protein
MDLACNASHLVWPSSHCVGSALSPASANNTLPSPGSSNIPTRITLNDDEDEIDGFVQHLSSKTLVPGYGTMGIK